MNYGLSILAFAALAAAPLSASPLTSPAAPTSLAKPTSAELDPQALVLARQFIALVSPPEAQERAWLQQVKAGAEQWFAGETDSRRSEIDRMLDQALAKAAPSIRDRLPQMNQAYAQAYARAYTVDELRQIVAFVEAPIGRRLFIDSQAILEDPEVKAANAGMIGEITKATLEEVAKADCQQKAAARVAAGDTKAKCPFA